MTVGGLSRWLLIVALFMRMMVPSGFMLAAGSSSVPTLVVCDGQGSAFAASSSHRTHQHGDRDTAAHADCPFSAGGAADLPSVAALLARSHQQFTPLRAFVPAPGYRPSAAAIPPPATGPPAIV